MPTLISTFVSTTLMLEEFVAQFPVHWTDVEFKNRRVEEVEAILGCLKGGLKELVNAFGPYANELGIGAGEMRMAKNVAGMVDKS